MFKTEDNYNLYFDGAISSDQEAIFEKLIEKYQLDAKFINLLKQHHNFRILDSYNLHRSVIWFLCQSLQSYAITIYFAEVEHPAGCEYQSKVDFYVDMSGHFDYELRNSLFLYDDYESSSECMERITQSSVGFDKDCKVRGNMRRMDLEAFVKSISSKD